MQNVSQPFLRFLNRLSLAKIQNAFEMNSMRSRLEHCYEDEIRGFAEFWRTTP